MMSMREVEEYFLMRRRKKIKLKEVAAYVGSSVSLISQHERLIKILSDEKERKYKEYIRTK